MDQKDYMNQIANLIGMLPDKEKFDINNYPNLTPNSLQVLQSLTQGIPGTTTGALGGGSVGAANMIEGGGAAAGSGMTKEQLLGLVPKADTMTNSNALMDLLTQIMRGKQRF